MRVGVKMLETSPKRTSPCFPPSSGIDLHADSSQQGGNHEYDARVVGEVLRVLQDRQYNLVPDCGIPSLEEEEKGLGAGHHLNYVKDHPSYPVLVFDVEYLSKAYWSSMQRVVRSSDSRRKVAVHLSFSTIDDEFQIGNAFQSRESNV